MDIEFDPAKDEANIAAHGLSFAAFEGFDTMPAVDLDDRKAYGEPRYRAFGRIDGAGHCLAFTIRNGRVRAISLRRAHEKEMRRYGQ